MTEKQKALSFKAIAAQTPGYETALTIYPPHTLGNDTGFIVAVGGSGVSHTKTLGAAKVRLLEEAKAYCLRRITRAHREMAHYRDELHRLEREGIEQT